MVQIMHVKQYGDFSIFFLKSSYKTAQNNSVEDTNKSSSEDIINRDTGKKQLPMITLFCIRLRYSALIFYHRQRETTK